MMFTNHKINSYAIMVAFMTVQVFTIPASGSHLGPPQPGELPHKNPSEMPKIEGDRKMAVEPAKEGRGERGADRERYRVALQRVIDCNVGLSAYISAIHELEYELQYRQEDFERRIDECEQYRDADFNDGPPRYSHCRHSVYWDTPDGFPQNNIMLGMFNRLHAYDTKYASAHEELITACEYLRPQDHYR